MNVSFIFHGPGLNRKSHLRDQLRVKGHKQPEAALAVSSWPATPVTPALSLRELGYRGLMKLTFWSNKM